MRARTTPERLICRARVILGSARGLGSRAMTRQEQLSRTTVRGWLARFAAERCDGLTLGHALDGHVAARPRTRALAALACERPAERAVPLSRYSLTELCTDVANSVPANQVTSRTSLWRLVAYDALRPWRCRSWLYPRDPHFLERATPVLDL